MVASISALTSSAQASSYYEADDYYSEGGLSPSEWQGAGAEALGLSGEVDRDQFRDLLDGRIGEQQLGTFRDSQLEHRPGWDVTLSAPKSVSIMAEVAGDRRLIAAHGEAVRTAMAHVERHMAATRIRDGGTVSREATGNLIVASFQHGTSRAQDPQLHTHNVIMNATRDEDGAWRSLEPRAIYQLQKQIGAIYRQELAVKVRELGYEIEAGKESLFEIKGVSSEVIAAFSTRSAEIEAALAERGTSRDAASAVEKQIATLDTREAKVAADHASLVADWRETASGAGFGAAERLAMIEQAEAKAADPSHRVTIEMQGDGAASRAVAHAADKLGERQSVFSAAALQEEAGRIGLGKIGYAQIGAAIDAATKQGELIGRTFQDRRGAEFAGFTTRQNVETEAKMLRIEAEGRDALSPLASPLAAAKAVAAASAQSERVGLGWNADQRAATEQLLISRNRITALQGYAGTAKTTTVLATFAREAEARGMAVTALAPTASAAMVLGDALGTRGDTVARHLLSPERPDPTRPAAWIVDEASLLSARDTARLFDLADKHDARIILVGDVKQLGSVEAGAAFAQLQGAGKSNTIGWLAHHAINLHDEADKAVFNTAIIVTDRIVLDRQLQSTVSQFEQVQGIVRKIDGTSRQLKEAIASGVRIIVTTIQKFSTEHLREISGQSGRTFAVIVDEAHSSQSGATAQAMTDALTREADSSDDIEDIIAAYQKARGPQANISFFAFTATPRNVTLERFGIKGPDGLPHPFHLYSMRQAVEEGFILDVLQNYMTYKAYYELEKAIEDDPKLSGRRGQRKVARYANLHPTAIGQKVEIVVEHFRRHVAKLLDGQAKAMIVTSSRDHALRYYFGVRDYIAQQGYADLRALVAFSGELVFNGEKYTEADLNGFAETELPRRFDGFKPDGTAYPEQYQILIVAEKYQTGFDQPKLCAMYVDRKLAGLQAVQTLSRLNRTRPGKDQTFILDFQNTTEDIQNAFRPYYEVTALEANSDPNLVYDLEGRLFKFGYLDKEEIERFAQTYFKGPLNGGDRARLEGLVRQAVTRFEADDDEGRQEEFRQLLRSYMRFYSFISQVMKLEDTSLEKLSAYAAWLSRLLPNREIPPEIEITDDMLLLQKFKVEQKEQGDASLSAGDHTPLKPISEFGAKPYTEDEQKELSEIVKAFNERHGTQFTEADMIRFEAVNAEILGTDLSEMLRNNPPDVVYTAFAHAFFQGAIRMFQRDNEMRNIVLSDADARDKATRHFFNRALRQVRDPNASPPPA